MSVMTWYYTDYKKWVDCIAETTYKYDDNNSIKLSCRRRAKCHPEDTFNLGFGKELAKAKAFVVLNKKKLDYLYDLSRKFSKEQKETKFWEFGVRYGKNPFYQEFKNKEYKPFKSKLTKLNEQDLEEIYQAIEELHKKVRTNW